MRRGGYIEETDVTQSKDYRLAGRLLPFITPHRGLLVTALLLVIVLTGLDLSIPWITKEALDRYIVPDPGRPETRLVTVDESDPAVRRFLATRPELRTPGEAPLQIPRTALKEADPETRLRLRAADMTGAVKAGLVLLVALFFNFLFGFCQTFVLETMGQRIIHDLRLTLFTHIRKLPVSWYHRNPTGRVVTRLTGDVENLREMFTSVITFVFRDIFLLAGILAMLIILDLRLAAVTLIVIPVAVVAAIGFARRSRSAFRDLRIRIAEINAHLAETIGGMSVIRLFAREKETDAAFKRLSDRHFDAGMAQVRIFALFMPVIEVLNSTALGLIIFYGGYRVMGGFASLGVLVAYISYLRMFFRPIRDIAEKYNILQNAFSSAERLFLILDTPMADDEQPGGDPGGAIDTIAFDDLSFGYTDGEPVLSGVSFTAKKGETIAIVGPTGAGKTSIVSLLVRFWDPQSGTIRVNGTPLSDLDPQRWRSRIAMVMQDPFLFAGTIRENILPDPDSSPSPETLDTALRHAGCGFVLDRLDQGMDTLLTEGGRPLSSGERQLLSIARAFVKNPELLILDEATSYVDSVSESEIQAALSRLMENRTTFLIAHRLSTARHADRILVVKGGRILESGSHDTLMEQKGIYFRMQQLENGLAAVPSQGLHKSIQKG
ncbi:ABC transporter ATP-binding protein [Desulfoluna spongiiphila]|uniref:ABC transporter ATP-binding protein n=1 Tax=Desulfoluna spongiiphila TaxID=419481 RepID=UPI00125B4463|nr:ABC transporter ATP-binding protein [Desulfoluna spongiiphila]VVS93925.1 abc transporter type 1 transmembrane domain [Desulfoluna spongiiphila]